MPSERVPKQYFKVSAIDENCSTSVSPNDEKSEHENDIIEHDFESPFHKDNDECNDRTIGISPFDGLTRLDSKSEASSEENQFLHDDEQINNDYLSIKSSHLHYYSCIPLPLRRLCTTNLVNDLTILRGYRRLCQVDQDLDVDDGGITLIKLIKLWIVVIGGILITHPFVRWMNWEIDDNYTISDFFLFDFTAVLFDMLFYFVVGRCSKVNIDKLFPWGSFIVLGCIYPSIANDFAFLRHSLSMYEMMCNWPWILFVYVATLLVLAVVLIGCLLRSHYQRSVLLSRCIESVVLTCIFILPFASDNNFHLHHWFGMWWLGMQANAPEWWSRAFQAYCLGCYINGIAVYGRDPILGCKMAFYRSTNANCSYMSCYEDTGENGTHYKPFIGPDWRTCNATVVP